MDRSSEGKDQKEKPELISKWMLAALVVGVAAIGLILYWPTLHLPLIYDDLLHIRITKALDLASVWLPTQDFGFYRPLTFLPLLIIKGLFGYYPSELLHAINVLQHSLNIALLTLLSWRLWRKIHWSIASGLLLALYPFSYQAIIVYGHNVHPATAGLMLIGLHSYLQAIAARKHHATWWILTAFLFLLGLLSHESAFLFGAYAAFVHWNHQSQLPRLNTANIQQNLTQIVKQPWFYFVVAGALYLFAYQLLPLSRAPQASFSAEATWYKLLYILQAAVYPISWLGQWLWSNVIIIAFGLILVIGLTAWSALRRENRLPLLMGWGWWFLAALVIGIPLSASYLLHGPRLLYVGSIGLAILWPVMLQPLWSLSNVGRGLWLTAIAFIIITSWLFVRDKLDIYSGLTKSVQVIEERMADRPAEEGVLVVNMPSWIAPVTNTYPVGVELVAMMGDYLFIDELINENLRSKRPTLALKIPDFLNTPNYNYGIHQESDYAEIEADWAPKGSQLFVTTYSNRGPETSHFGGFLPREGTVQTLATLGPYELLKVDAAFCDSVIQLATTWRITEENGQQTDISPTTSLFVQLLAEDGQLLSQLDGPPLRIRPDLLHVPADWHMDDQRELPALENNTGEMLLGAYDFASGERFSATDGEGKQIPENALSIPIARCK